MSLGNLSSSTSLLVRLVIYFGIKWGGLMLGLFFLSYALSSLNYISPVQKDNTYQITDKSSIDTGDLILCCGKTDSSRTIRLFSHVEWTHVGMAVRIRDQLYIAHADVNTDLRNYLFSQGNDQEEEEEKDDEVKKERNPGVQINSLHDFLAVYPGDVYIRPMRLKYRPKAEDVWRICYSYRGYTFRKFLPALVRSIAGRCSWLPEVPVVPALGWPRQSFFCSHFLAQLLVELGFLDDETCVVLYHPCSFAPEYDRDQRLSMQFAPGVSNPFHPFTRIISNRLRGP